MKNLKSFDEFLNESNEMKNFKPGQKIKWSGPKGEVEDVIKSIDGIYLVLKSGGKIPYQSVIECDEAAVNEIRNPSDANGNPLKVGQSVKVLSSMTLYGPGVSKKIYKDTVVKIVGFNSSNWLELGGQYSGYKIDPSDTELW